MRRKVSQRAQALSILRGFASMVQEVGDFHRQMSEVVSKAQNAKPLGLGDGSITEAEWTAFSDVLKAAFALRQALRNLGATWAAKEHLDRRR